MPRPPPGLVYSYLSASIGFSRDAFRAGKNPDTIPTSDRIANEIIIKKQVSKFQGFQSFNVRFNNPRSRKASKGNLSPDL